MSTRLDILEFFIKHHEQEFTLNELCKEFNLSKPAMYSHINKLLWGDWINKRTKCFPIKYKFNELFLVLLRKT